MKIGKLSALALVSTAAIAGTSLYVSRSHADPPKIVAPALQSLPRRAAPIALDPAKRSLKIAAAFKAAGVVANVPQTLEMRMTPMAPRASNGAQIIRAGQIFFNGADADEPDGSYLLRAPKEAFAVTSVVMRLPTETGKHYMVDCRLHPTGSGTLKVIFVRGTSASGQNPVEDGHIFYVFLASSASTELSVSPVPDGSGDNLGWFYGCDVGKALI